MRRDWKVVSSERRVLHWWRREEARAALWEVVIVWDAGSGSVSGPVLVEGCGECGAGLVVDIWDLAADNTQQRSVFIV